jgi:Zn-dependent protease/CBS domain-containing protein
MKSSFRIGRVLGINIHLHWTFLLLIALFGISELATGNLRSALIAVLFILTVFSAVVLHELGHAVVARRFGIKTRDITLLPIGGIARLERIPTKPIEEILVGIAGPLVNGLLAGALLFLAWAIAAPPEGFVWRLIWMNVSLAAFNLLPAFPMDGGRVFRALLALRYDRDRSTAIAARAGRAIAYAMFAAGIFYSPMLILIAVFVWFGATQEEEMTRLTSGLEGLTAKDAMIARFDVLRADQRLGDALQLMMRGFQPGYPVADDERVIGMLTERELVRAFEQRGPDVPVREVMRRDVASIETREPLDRALDRMLASGVSMLPVLHGDRVVGILTEERLAQISLMRRHSPPWVAFRGPPLTQP